MKVYAYLRVSTVGQAVDGVSLAAQEEKIRTWCRTNGHRLDTVFSDRGKSGGRADNRPQLQKLLKAISTSRKCVLVIYSLSRLARSTRDTLDLAEKLDKAGCDLVSLSEKIDSTTASGKMVFRLLAVLSEFERDLTSERTKTAIAHKKANGERVGTVPYGFDLDDDEITLIENPVEQGVITDIKSMRKRGMKLKQIADDLTKRRIKTKMGNRQWSHQTIASILKR